jgi:glycosyltransferase involved in cell wall biosynthesis
MGKLPDEALPRFYASIDAVVIPSLYEGFGLPVIEGMAARIPVIAANATSLPEVGGDVALYFDPHSPEELAAVLAKVANEGVPLRQIEAGYERAKRLSWRNCLEGIYEVYDEVMRQKLKR